MTDVTTVASAMPLPDIVKATCSVCNAKYKLDKNINSREGHLCPKCGASGRSQAIAYCVTRYVFGQDKALSKVRAKKKIKMVGLSDGQVYARPLSRKCDYTNTFYHQDPFLDITNPQDDYFDKFDGLISADVFEHVLASPCHAFEGAYKILKPGGHLILTVPFTNKGPHIEHYPGLVGYESEERKDGRWVAHLEFSDGRKSIDETPCFHGGPGKTLELRIFNRARVEEELCWAGFTNIEILDDNIPEWGINWNAPSRIIVAQKPDTA